MKIKYWASVMLASFLFISCDDNTDNIGFSLIDNVDKLEISTDTFCVSSQSIVADSVLSRNYVGYLGKVRDPETGVLLASDFMTQFYCPEGFEFPVKDSIQSRMDGEVIADSCDIRLYYTSYYGDTLATMKVNALELSRPMSEKNSYYSNFNPEKEGYIKSNGISTNKVYTLTDLNEDASTRYSSDYIPSIRIPLDKEYNGYNNYGTYILRKFYDNPESFKDALTFINNVAPGFYFKSKSGIGALAYVKLSQLNVYFRHKTTVTKSDGTKNDTIISAMATFPGTEEVLQTTNVMNDNNAIRHLADDNTCTYLKTPAGIFTEMTIPVENITGKAYNVNDKRYHANDSINTAKIVLTRINDTNKSQYALPAPKTLLMIPKSKMFSFFENSEVADFKTSFLASFNSSTNTYTFSNIGGLVKYMDGLDKSIPDWNKVVIIPVTTTYNSQNELTKVDHDMSMTSTKLVGGKNSKYGDIKLYVVYSKFK